MHRRQPEININRKVTNDTRIIFSCNYFNPVSKLYIIEISIVYISLSKIYYSINMNYLNIRAYTVYCHFNGDFPCIKGINGNFGVMETILWKQNFIPSPHCYLHAAICSRSNSSHKLYIIGLKTAVCWIYCSSMFDCLPTGATAAECILMMNPNGNLFQKWPPLNLVMGICCSGLGGCHLHKAEIDTMLVLCCAQ
jgi:hypothetical protein